jgi:hypothetical protein
MKFFEFEKMFKRAMKLSFLKKKILFTYPFLFLAGSLIVFFRFIAYSAANCVALFLIGFSILFTILVLYLLGIFLSKIYYNEVKKNKFLYFDIVKKSINNCFHSLHFSMPPILIFIIIWMFFGLFVMIKEIPHVGTFIGSLIFLMPFFLTFASIILCFISLLLLFFATPVLALNLKNSFQVLKDAFCVFKKDLFKNFLNFSFALSLSFFVFLILYISNEITKYTFLIPFDKYSASLQTFSAMSLFVLFLAPFVIFFFNFAIEIYNYYQMKDK